MLHLEGSLTDTSLHLFKGKLLCSKIFFHQLVIDFADAFDEVLTSLCSLRHHLLWNVSNLELSALGLILVKDRLHFNEINNSEELALSTNRKLNWKRLSTEPLTDRSYALLEASAHSVHLVDEAETRNTELVSLTPNSLRLWFYSAHCIEYSNCAVKHTKRTLYFNRKINVAWSIDYVDLILRKISVRTAPLTCGCS